MQLVGIGFPRSYWISLIKRLQNQVSHQLIPELVGESNSVLKTGILSKESADIPEWLIKAQSQTGFCFLQVRLKRRKSMSKFATGDSKK